MKEAYLGIDIGSISTKGVIIDEKNKYKKDIQSYSDSFCYRRSIIYQQSEIYNKADGDVV